MSTKPTSIIDPVCGMTVDVAKAEGAGLTVEYDSRTFAFCGPGCRRAFVEEPERYAAPSTEAAHAGDLAGQAMAVGASLPVIDDGMRRWYESCSCCLSEAYPDVKARLDAERAAAAAAPVEAGICEVAEAAIVDAEVSATNVTRS